MPALPHCRSRERKDLPPGRKEFPVSTQQRASGPSVWAHTLDRKDPVHALALVHVRSLDYQTFVDGESMEDA